MTLEERVSKLEGEMKVLLSINLISLALMLIMVIRG